MKLIDKDKVIAKIESLQDATMDEDMNFYSAKAEAEFCILSDLENFIDTIETKEVDLEEEIKRMYLKYRQYGGNKNILVILNELQFNDIAKHFYELGLKAKE